MAKLETGLRRARLKSGLKQGDLAERAGISRQTLSVLESGRGQPSTAVALQLARVLGCRVEELFWLREEGGDLTAELADGAEIRGAKPERALIGSVAGRWVAHALPREDPLGLTTAADALVVRSPQAGHTVKLRTLRLQEALEANVLQAGSALRQPGARSGSAPAPRPALAEGAGAVVCRRRLRAAPGGALAGGAGG